MKTAEQVQSAIDDFTTLRRNPGLLKRVAPGLESQLPGIIAAFRYVMEDEDRPFTDVHAEVVRELERKRAAAA